MAHVIVFNSKLFVAETRYLFSYDITSRSNQDLKYHIPLHKASLKNNENNQEEENEAEVYIVCSVISNNGKYLGVCTSNKQLIVIGIEDLSFEYNQALVKRPTGLVLDDENNKAIVCDKAGDVYCFDLVKSSVEEQRTPQLLLGHTSMLLAMKLSNDKKFLITADRDETIRVSHYENGDKIYTYCLGHTDFVSCLELLTMDNELMLSGGGDGQLILWNIHSGKELDRRSLQDNKIPLVIHGIATCERDVFVICESVSTIFHFQIQDQKLVDLPPIRLEEIPRSIISSNIQVYVLLDSVGTAEIARLNIGTCEPIQLQKMKDLTQRIHDDTLLQNVNWDLMKLSSLRRTEKRKEVDSISSSTDVDIPTKIAKQ